VPITWFSATKNKKIVMWYQLSTVSFKQHLMELWIMRSKIDAEKYQSLIFLPWPLWQN